MRFIKPLIATPRRDAENLATGLGGASLAAAAITGVLVATNLGNAPQWPAFLEIIPLIAAYAIAGGLIARRRSDCCQSPAATGHSREQCDRDP